MRLPSHCGLMRHLISLVMHFKNIKRHDEYQWSSWQGIYYMKYQEAFQFSFLPFRTSKGTRVTTGNAWKGLGHQRNSGWNIMNKEQKCVKKKKKILNIDLCLPSLKNSRKMANFWKLLISNQSFCKIYGCCPYLDLIQEGCALAMLWCACPL